MTLIMIPFSFSQNVLTQTRAFHLLKCILEYHNQKNDKTETETHNTHEDSHVHVHITYTHLHVQERVASSRSRSDCKCISSEQACHLSQSC